MTRNFIIFLFLGFTLIGQELKINTTYDSKPYKLYSVYSYKDKTDQPIGFLGYRLARIYKDDRQALWELRKYQLSRSFGSTLMVTGLFTIFFENFKFTRTGNVGFNVLIGTTLMALGYGVGFRYSNFCLLNSIDIFNTNLQKNIPESSFKIEPILEKDGFKVLVGFGF